MWITYNNEIDKMDYLDHLEAEAIYILREVAGQFEKPALLFSGGKDSITLVHLAQKAFKPGKFPFPLAGCTNRGKTYYRLCPRKYRSR